MTKMSSKVISSSTPNGETSRKMPANCEYNDKGKKGFLWVSNHVSSLKEMVGKIEKRRLIHSFKVGLALVLVSLLYLLDPLFKQVGENAMWAIMTVVVIFEFYAGATLSKGINRGIGTILGGGLGCLAAIVADEVGGNLGNAIVVGISVFSIGAAATYSRMDPRIKKRYDYGVMIFVLTFNLVVVSGVRADKVLSLARQRLSTIGMGFAVCLFTSLLVFPMWASDELHASTASKFDKLASSIEGCLEEYLGMADEKESKAAASNKGCTLVLNSKANDESLANFAKWEPWHGKFGLSYPWEMYLEIGEVLRGLAATVFSLSVCLQSSRQPPVAERERLKEASEILSLSITWALRELGESIKEMKMCRAKGVMLPKLQRLKQELSRWNYCVIPSNVRSSDYNNQQAAVSTYVFLMMEMVDKLECLAIKVEELGEQAHFQPKILQV